MAEPALRVAWFRAALPDTNVVLDEMAPIIDRLRRTDDIDVVTEVDAHDFVWKHFRQPYDVCVYELGSTAAHGFLRAYLSHYPGVIAPRGLGVALPSLESQPSAGANARRRAASELTIGLLDAERSGIVRRAVERARASGAHVQLLAGDATQILRDADVICAVEWPPLAGAPTPALLGFAAAKPVIVFEVEGTAGWPALDPQTWQPRGFDMDQPIAVSVDPRDEEHSLMLAMKRLASDAALREALGRQGHAWWRAHATLDHAVRAWQQLLADARMRRPGTHGAADHTAHVRAVLDHFGVSVDFLPTRSPGQS